MLAGLTIWTTPAHRRAALLPSPDDFDASQGWTKFLERQGLSLEKQKLHFRFYTHCAVQAICTQFADGLRRQLTHGAMSGFISSPIPGYDFETTYTGLERVYRGQHAFEPRIQSLSNVSAQFPFLPNPSAGVLNAKYLIENFVLPNLQNPQAFIDDFQSYSGNVCASAATVSRAIEQISTKATFA